MTNKTETTKPDKQLSGDKSDTCAVRSVVCCLASLWYCKLIHAANNKKEEDIFQQCHFGVGIKKVGLSKTTYVDCSKIKSGVRSKWKTSHNY